MPLTLGQLLPFLFASFVISAVPGPDIALITRQVLRGGVSLARRTIVGNLSGLLVHGLALAAGLSALLLASATAYTVVKIAGACYLIYLGTRALRSARHSRDEPRAAARQSTGGPARTAHGLPTGLISTVLNPKPALFFLTFLPQFLDPSRPALPQALTMAALHVAMGLVVLSAYAQLVHRAHGILARPTVTLWLERLTGTVLIGLGPRVALARR